MTQDNKKRVALIMVNRNHPRYACKTFWFTKDDCIERNSNPVAKYRSEPTFAVYRSSGSPEYIKGRNVDIRSDSDSCYFFNKEKKWVISE